MTLPISPQQRSANTQPIPRVEQIKQATQKRQENLADNIEESQTNAIKSNTAEIKKLKQDIKDQGKISSYLKPKLSAAQKQNPTIYANAEYRALIAQGKKFNFTFKNGVFYDDNPLSAFDINAEERADELEWLNRKAMELRKKYSQKNPTAYARAKSRAYYTLWGKLSERQNQDNFKTFQNHPKVTAFINKYSNSDVIINKKRGVFEFKSGGLAFIDGTNEDIDLDWINSEFQIILNTLAKGKKQQIIDRNLTKAERKRIYGGKNIKTSQNQTSQKNKNSKTEIAKDRYRKPIKDGTGGYLQTRASAKPQPKSAASALFGNIGAPTPTAPRKPIAPTRLKRKSIPREIEKTPEEKYITMENIDKQFLKINRSIQEVKTGTYNVKNRTALKTRIAKIAKSKPQQISPKLARETMFYTMKTIKKPQILKGILLKLLKNIPNNLNEKDLKEKYIIALGQGMTADGTVNKNHPLYKIQQIFLSKKISTDEKIHYIISATEKI